MKVLLINNCHWPRGGSEAVYFNTAKLLNAHGHEVIFFSREDKYNIKTSDKEYFTAQPGGLKKIKNIFANSDAAQKLEEILEKEKLDIAHAHLFWGGISPSIIKVLHKHGVPFVHTAHDYRMVCPAYLLKDGKGQFCERCKGGKFYHCALHRCSKGNLVESLLMTAEMYYRNHKWHPAKEIDRIIFVSNFSKQKHLAFDKQFSDAKTTVLYNCPGENVENSLYLERDTFGSYYLFYGRLSQEKGVPTLIKAFEKFPQLNLRIVGTGPIEDELRVYCNEKKLINIDFCGYKTGKELYDLVAGAKYVCVPSECYENNPMTIVEAYSLGTPVIGAAIGGISEIVADKDTGFTFESGSTESLTEAIGKASSLSREEYALQKRRAYEFGKENFSREKHLEQLLKIYEECINKSFH